MTSANDTTPHEGADLDPANPFAAPSALPYELPDFAAIDEAHYEPAIVAGIAAHRGEVEAIATNPEPATVENTLDALERAGQLLNRAVAAFYNQLPADSTPGLEDIQERVAPQLAAHQDSIMMDARLHDRVRSLAAAATAGTIALQNDTAYLLEKLLTQFKRSGIALSAADQGTLRDLNARITSLQASFGRKLLAGANEASVLVTTEAELAGLSAGAKAGARAAAEARGQDGWLLEMQLFTHQSVLASLEDPQTRARVQLASMERGAVGGETDTRAVLLELARLRAEHAQLLGYEHHAAYVAADATAGTTTAVNEMLARLAPAAVTNARHEASELAKVSGTASHGTAGAGGTSGVAAADWSYLNEAVRKELFNLDDAALRPYLELERVVHDGVFRAASKLFGLSFTERYDLLGYHPDVRVFEVFDAPEPGEPNRGLGLFLADWYTRESKRGGAWMNSFVQQNHLLGHKPVVLNNLNIVRPPAGEPTLLGWDEVTTLFHEFGHALHGLLSSVRYPSQSGTSVPRDFVEFPSQVNEMWSWEPEILRSFAVHHTTGEPMPAEWVETMLASRTWGEGFATTEYLAAALLDQAWHQLAPSQVPTSVEEVLPFEAAALAAAGVDLDEVPPRYRSTYFNHIFGGGYSAGYYSYIWSEVLDADTVQWYADNGGLTRENGDAFRHKLLARGGSQDPLQSFRDLRGRTADIAPLLARRGLSG